MLLRETIMAIVYKLIKIIVLLSRETFMAIVYKLMEIHCYVTKRTNDGYCLKNDKN